MRRLKKMLKFIYKVQNLLANLYSLFLDFELDDYNHNQKVQTLWYYLKQNHTGETGLWKRK